MRRARALGVALLLAGGAAQAQGVAPGGPIGGSTGIGSGLGGINGTGPSFPNGTNQAPQPTIPSIPPGGYPTPAPTSSYRAPQPSVAPPASAGSSTYRQPNEPSATSTPQPPATIPLELPAQAEGFGFLKGCWRSDIFADGPRKATITWCFDDKGAGRYLYTRTDQGSLYCHGQARAMWDGRTLDLSSPDAACADKILKVPHALTCNEGTDGALCHGAGEAATVRLYRVR